MYRKLLPVLSVFILTACGTNLDGSPAPGELTPYQTLTPSLTVTMVIGTLPGGTLVASPTPFTYIIQAGDTMGALSKKFGVSVDALIAANPTISPNAMPIGAVLLIPTDKNNPTGESTPTPLPFAITQIQCYSTLDNGMWCFLLARNDSDEAMENLSAQVLLLNTDRGVIASQVAIPPMNILPAHTSMPLTVFFPAPIPGNATPIAQILSATVLANDPPRYLKVSLVNSTTEIALDGRSARVSGSISLPADSAPAQTIWVAAVAYDAGGRVVGFRRWEGSGLQPGGVIPFGLTVASLGSPVARVEIFVEARP